MWVTVVVVKVVEVEVKISGLKLSQVEIPGVV
jgi:hypothetical protein